MGVPNLTPASTLSRLVLPSTGSASEVTEDCLPYGLYLASDVDLKCRTQFVSGAMSQVAFTYRMLGGAVLDVELTTKDVYAAYELACMEYSYLVNLHQAKTSLPNLLGQPTASFDYKGEYCSGSLSSSLSGGNVALKHPHFQFAYTNRYATAVGSQIAIGGTNTIYSASIATTGSKQDYDLQTIIQNQSNNSDRLFFNKVNNRRVKIHTVYYKSPRAIWRFYGYYGGIAAVGNLSTYGQFADDHTFQVVPTWQNKAQAAAYEDAISTRISHYSYKIRNNQIRIYPPPDETFSQLWVEFSVDQTPWEEPEGVDQGVDGINNINTLPFANIPYKNINSMGKHWIRRYALAQTKIMLANNRGKYQTIPIPGESVTLNYADLITQGKEEQEKLKEELKTVLDDLTYVKMSEDQAAQAENANKTLDKMPTLIYMG